MQKQRKLRKGMSLVEIVAVIAIIAIIGLVAIARFGRTTEAARVSAFESSFNNAVVAINMFAAANGGAYPTTLDAMEPFLAVHGAAGAGAVHRTLLRTGSTQHTVTATMSATGELVMTIDGLSVDATGAGIMTTPATPGGTVGVYELRFNPRA
ncbi:MAG: prepilin-type N-terminal cleavage/methylation domain-containing protein [Defluviitaleaceae bacterium]|nr:prepilin-type N-terminal cleavage/methylation domain-containing protein [Defluviitaleaceae bacterium]